MKNILILTGSPRKNDSSSLLADQFEKGTISSGNTPVRFDTAFLDINTAKVVIFAESMGTTTIKMMILSSLKTI